MIGEFRDLEFLATCDVEAPKKHGDVFIAALTVTPTLIKRVYEAQQRDLKVRKMVEDLVIDELDECPTPWRVDIDGALRLGNRLVVSDGD